MSVLDRLRDNLRTQLPGAIDRAVELELFNVIDEFCRTTNAYRELIETTLTEGESIYQIEPPDREILLVYQTAHLTMTVVGAVFDDGRIGLPLDPTAEDVAHPLLTEVSLTPRYGGSQDPVDWLPVELYERWFQTLLNGVLWRMMSQPAKPYSSERLALYHSRRFRNGMAIARTRAVGDSEPNSIAWAFPAFT